MISDLELINFNQLRDSEPDRFNKADLAAFAAVESDPGRWATQRGPSEDSHVSELVRFAGFHLGKCSCKGFKHHGTCSHLCGLYRMADAGLVDVPRAIVRRADVEVPGEDQTLSQAVDRATAADGGRRPDR
jgi:hypothetical protein